MTKESKPELKQYTGHALIRHMQDNHTFPKDPNDVRGALDYEEVHTRAHKGEDPFMTDHSHKKSPLRRFGVLFYKRLHLGHKAHL